MTITAYQAFRTISAVFNVCGKQRGAIGEAVSQAEHARQAAFLALQFNEPPTLVIATLFHDVGHLIPFGLNMMGPDGKDLGNLFHEYDGAELLHSFGYPLAVTEPVRMHVLAKRYVISQEKENIDKLSAASRASFEQQGGVMSQELMDHFEQHQYFNEAMKLRNYEDQAKNVDITYKLPDIHEYKHINEKAWKY